VVVIDVFSSLDGFGSYDGGNWGGYWGKQGPEFLDRRIALYREEQRMVIGANTYRQCVQLREPDARRPRPRAHLPAHPACLSPHAERPDVP